MASEAAGPASLAGKRVVITRPRERAAAWVDAFRAAGADVIACPVIELSPVEGAARDEAVAQLTQSLASDGLWLAFTSVPGVERTLELLEETQLTTQLQQRTRIGSVGPLTTSALEAAGWRVDAEPDESNAGALARQILLREPKPTVVHPTSNRGRVELSMEIERSGGACQTIVVYENSPRAEFTDVEQNALAGDCDLIAFASPTAVEAAFAAAPEATHASLLAVPAVVVGETTAEAARRAGFSDVVVAVRPRIDEVVRAAAEMGFRTR